MALFCALIEPSGATSNLGAGAGEGDGEGEGELGAAGSTTGASEDLG